MAEMPAVVTHRYHPAVGPYRNLCSLPDTEASQVINRLSQHRPNLKRNYLARRRSVEQWLSISASALLGQTVKPWPTYFFLGDFSHVLDESRPSSLVIPLDSLPHNGITFTLGDSMKVAEQQMPRLYRLREMAVLFADEEPVAGFGLTDQAGAQNSFIEMQLWNCAAWST